MTSTQPPRTRLPLVIGLGAAAAVGGVVVLRSPSATGVGAAWFTYGPPPPVDVLAGLMAWNGPRLVGAGLVVVGLLVLAAALGAGWGRKGGPRPGRRILVAGAVLSAVLVLVGAVAFGHPCTTPVSYTGTYELIRGRRPIEPLPPIASMVWTRGQVVAALVATVGLLVGSCLVGLVSGRRHAVRG